MMAHIMNLSMTVMTASHDIIGSGFNNLVKFHLAISSAGFCETGLEKTATATTAVVVGLVWRHLYNVFLTHAGGNNISKVICNNIAFTFAYNLTWILDSKLDLSVFIPVGVNLQSSLANPFRVVSIDRGNFKFVIDIEFFQSGPD